MKAQVIDHPWKTWSSETAYGSTGPHLEFVITFDDGLELHGVQSYDSSYTPKGRYGRSDSTRAKRDKKARVYVSSDAPFNLIESLENRCRRPHDVYKPYVLDVFNRLGVTGKFLWNQRAGCSCPCSPGFIAQADELRGWEFWLTIPGVTMVDENEEPRNLTGVML